MLTDPAFVSPFVLNSPTLTQIDYDPAFRVAEFETNVTDHWLLDSGDASCLIGGNGGALTLAGSNPTYTGALAATPPVGGAYLKTADGGKNGLITPYVEQQTQTEWAVVRKDALTGSYGEIPIFGTLSDVDTTSGHMAYKVGGFFDTARTASGSSVSSQLASTASPATGTWLLVVVAQDGSGRMVYVGNIGVATDSAIKVVSARNNALGNAYYGNAAWEQGVTVAEYGLLSGYKLSQTDCDGLYARAKVRAARRGITLY